MTTACGTRAYTFVWRDTTQGDEYALGDVNADGTVDIEDVNCLINIILNGTDPADYGNRADIDGTPGIDVGDVNAAINIILGS